MDAVVDSHRITLAVHEALEEHGHSRGELIPVLKTVGEALGYLPALAMVEVARAMQIAPGQVFSVATFYTLIPTEPRGRHVIQFCESAPCHVQGGRLVWETLRAELGISPGETTPDGRWTLLTTSCIGQCDRGPVMMVDDDLHGDLTPDGVGEILERYE